MAHLIQEAITIRNRVPFGNREEYTRAQDWVNFLVWLDNAK